MFYPMDSLKRGGRFYLCWVADSWPLRFATVTHRQLWSQDIRKICEDLMKVVINESGRPTKRFSLRLSSQLVHGLVRLYQRKTAVLLSEICMINAHVMKNTNKKWYILEEDELEHRGRSVHLPLQQLPNIPEILLHDETENVQRVEDLIQNSRNVVSNIQDITLKESAIPEFRITAADGFGEENPDKVLQLVGDRTLEVMLHAESFAMQHSGLDVQLDVTTKSHDKSRPPHEPQMQRISEHDITMFGKEIPEIPDIPLPDLPVPQLEKTITENRENLVPLLEAAKIRLMIPAEQRSSIEIVLEELDETEMQPKRRKLKNKLIIDKNTKISADVLRSRIGNAAVETRCQDSSDDIIETRLPCDVYFRRPCHAEQKIDGYINYTLTSLFLRNLGIVNTKPLAEREVEEAMAHSHQLDGRSILDNIQIVDQLVTQEIPQLSQIHIDQADDVNICKEYLLNVTEPHKLVTEEETDISCMVTLKVETLSQQSRNRAGQETNKLKRQRSQQYATKQSQQAVAEYISPHETEKGNIPTAHECLEDSGKSVTAMLHEAGIADMEALTVVNDEEQPVDATQKRVTRGSEGSETPLGSLDRTKVSLGDSDQTTDSKRFIRDQWGTEGTMMKILNNIKSGVSPMTVETLVQKGPVLPGHKKIIAARCFSSLLKLKQHGFINLQKRMDTLQVTDITLGTKFN